MRQAITETAAEALSRLKPARLVLGKARTPGLIEDGRLPTVIDDTLVAMQAIGEDGGRSAPSSTGAAIPRLSGGRKLSSRPTSRTRRR